MFYQWYRWAITSGYNRNDQLTNEVSSVTGTMAYAYDDNGSLTSQTRTGGSSPETTTYTYDLENRLATANVSRKEGTNDVSVVANYIYNPFGIRVRSDTQSGGSTQHKFFLVDSMNHTGYAQVLEESSSTDTGMTIGSSALDRSYVIGDDVIDQTTGAATHYLGYDGHGSTRILTDSDGASCDDSCGNAPAGR